MISESNSGLPLLVPPAPLCLDLPPSCIRLCHPLLKLVFWISFLYGSPSMGYGERQRNCIQLYLRQFLFGNQIKFRLFNVSHFELALIAFGKLLN